MEKKKIFSDPFHLTLSEGSWERFKRIDWLTSLKENLHNLSMLLLQRNCFYHQSQTQEIFNIRISSFINFTLLFIKYFWSSCLKSLDHSMLNVLTWLTLFQLSSHPGTLNIKWRGPGQWSQTRHWQHHVSLHHHYHGLSHHHYLASQLLFLPLLESAAVTERQPKITSKN